MPTLEHNGLVEMFREKPSLAPHLLDGQGALVLAIILELQRDKDPRKKGSWPAYVAAVHARRRCPTIVLVVTSDADVASWAAEPIDLGLGLSIVRPLVLGPAIVPEVTDQAQADRETELSILSAVAHGNGPNGLAVVLAAIGALGRLDQEHAAVYFQIVYGALREPMQKALDAKIMERQTEAQSALPPFLQRLIDGSKVEGFRDGELKGKREALLRLVARAGLTLTPDDRTRIETCEDSALLDRWVDNVLGAKSAADVLA